MYNRTKLHVAQNFYNNLVAIDYSIALKLALKLNKPAYIGM